MNIRIPLKAVAFVLYTLALLGGAFGISYAVFEWRDDDEAPAFDSSGIERRISALERQISAGPTEAELDAQRCAAALEAAGVAASQPAAQPSGNIQSDVITSILGGRGGVPQEIQDAIDRYCN